MAQDVASLGPKHTLYLVVKYQETFGAEKMEMLELRYEAGSVVIILHSTSEISAEHTFTGPRAVSRHKHHLRRSEVVDFAEVWAIGFLLGFFQLKHATVGVVLSLGPCYRSDDKICIRRTSSRIHQSRILFEERQEKMPSRTSRLQHLVATVIQYGFTYAGEEPSSSDHYCSD